VLSSHAYDDHTCTKLKSFGKQKQNINGIAYSWYYVEAIYIDYLTTYPKKCNLQKKHSGIVCMWNFGGIKDEQFKQRGI